MIRLRRPAVAAVGGLVLACAVALPLWSLAQGNAAHLRAIWVTLVVIEISRIAGFVLAHGLTTAFASSATVVFPQLLADPIDLVRLFVIFVVLILAEVFRQGTQLREETELTV